MAKKKLREKAIKLRVEEKLSYSEIKKRLDVPKSTLSYWLRSYPLSEKRIKKLKKEGREKINYKGRFNHGTCKAKVSGKEITEKIKMQMRVIQDHFN